jgi:hypothetical protein
MLLTIFNFKIGDYKTQKNFVDNTNNILFSSFSWFDIQYLLDNNLKVEKGISEQIKDIQNNFTPKHISCEVMFRFNREYVVISFFNSRTKNYLIRLSLNIIKHELNFYWE